MATESVWQGTAGALTWPALRADLQVDVAIVGAGITGVTAAWLLARAGRSVALLDAGAVGAGSTGRSTGNLYATVSEGLHTLRGKWDADTVRAVAASRADSIDFIEQAAAALGGRCAFRRCPLYSYAGSPEAQQQVADEQRAALDAGLPARLVDALPPGPPAPQGPVLLLEGQAQFHPLAYVQALAEQAAAAGARVFEHSAALEVDASQGRVRTAGATVRAREIVLATHSPGGFHLVQAGMLPRREYGVAARWDTAFPPGIFWAKGAERLSMRALDTPQGRLLVCVGEEHKTGQHDPADALAALEERARRRLGLQAAEFRWSAQNFASPDGLPYIGRDASGCYIATGFATDGLVYGTLAARIVAAQVLGQDDRWGALYKATRFTPVASARTFAEETAAVVKAVVQDYLTQRQHGELAALQPGSAAIVDLDGERLAAYRDAQGRLSVVSPVCTHLKCQVHWNAVETSWDCPCHGSRFAPDGRVIEGPALRPLARKTAPPA